MDLPITDKQKSFILDIMEFVDKPFDFSTATRKSASKYISENIEMYKLLTLDNWVLESGEF